MFVLIVRMKAIREKQEELEKLLHDYAVKIRQNEPDNLVYNWHRKLDDPAQLFFYEMYKDRKAWTEKHMTKPYVKKIGDLLPSYIEGDVEMLEYELAESA